MGKISWTDRVRNEEVIPRIKEERNIFTYLHSTWNRVLHEKLARFQLVKKFPPFYETRRFITAVTSARHLSLS